MRAAFHAFYANSSEEIPLHAIGYVYFPRVTFFIYWNVRHVFIVTDKNAFHININNGSIVYQEVVQNYVDN